MNKFTMIAKTQTKNYEQLTKTIAKFGFWFFLIKGLLWLAVPFVFSYFALNS